MRLHDRGKGDGPMVRKELNNKVCTSKGMKKDRRIRLSANTAIQFYDVQDRLGYDRPSNAIDWLMKEAKVAIDSLYSDPFPFTTTIFNPSEAFHRTPGDQNETTWNRDRTSGFFNNQPFGFMNLINRYQTEGGGENPVIVNPQETNHFSAPLDFIWNPNYNTGEGFASVLREPLQSSFLNPISHTSENEFTNDNGLMGFSFQQEIQVQEDED